MGGALPMANRSVLQRSWRRWLSFSGRTPGLFWEKRLVDRAPGGVASREGRGGAAGARHAVVGVWRVTKMMPLAGHRFMVTLRELHRFQTARCMVQLRDGRVGKIVRVDTTFPGNRTEVSVYTL